jgi:hypothetical protein
LCQVLFSLTVVPVAPHLVNPGLYPLFAARKWASDSDELFEGVGLQPYRTDHGATFLHHKLDAVAGLQAEAFTNLLRNSNLAFAADCTGVIHLYLSPLQ